jgi:hypothetical protein
MDLAAFQSILTVQNITVFVLAILLVTTLFGT